MKHYSKEMIDAFLESHGGDAVGLLEVFPFSKESRKRIDEAYEDEDNYTDSDVCDLILELAYAEA